MTHLTLLNLFLSNFW